jgi:hypothetical protein
MSFVRGERTGAAMTLLNPVLNTYVYIYYIYILNGETNEPPIRDWLIPATLLHSPYMYIKIDEVIKLSREPLSQLSRI